MEELRASVIELLDAGVSGSEIARRLGVSHSTVSRIAARLGRRLGPARGSQFDWVEIRKRYEAGQSIAECCRRFKVSRGAWDRAVTRGDIVPRPKSAPSPSVTRLAVQERLGAGMSQVAIAAELGLSKATIAHHVRALGIPPDERFSRRYDWAEVQRAHDAGMGARDCCEHFGFALSTWSKAVQTGRLVPREWRIPLEDLLVRGRRTGRGHLKKRLIAAGLMEMRCGRCGLTDWRGEPIGLELHHKNGDGKDNRLSNLEILCPNCHAQTDTWGGRNSKRKPGRHLKLVPPPTEIEDERVG
jgi:DNA-binding CsgD family transcriptional regulator/5-methylcytosine-specific restriction endonuclease McrA